MIQIEQNRLLASARQSLFTLTLLMFLALSNAGKLLADEPQHIKLSPRALGMGNAFVAVANDEYALYYNPAGLQSVQQVIFEIVTVGATVGQNILDLQDEDDQNAALGKMVGKKLYVEGNASFLSLTAPGWGWSTFAGLVFAPTVHNPTIPYLELSAYAQFGVVGGFAVQTMDYTLDVGLGVKSISRVGIGGDYHLVDFLDDDFADNLEEEAGQKDATVSDLGVIYHWDQWYNYDTRIGVVLKNIGGADFGSSGELPQSLDLGVATFTEQLGMDFLFAADFVDATFTTTEKKDWRRNLNLGMELGLWKRNNNHHFLALRAGRKGIYPTYGLSLNVPYFPLMIDYAHWSEEVGAIAGSIEDERHTIQISINF